MRGGDPAQERERVASRWSGEGAGRRYADSRWRSARAEARDPLLVRRILSRHGVPLEGTLVLDAPCGTGRLHPVLSPGGARYLGVDLSPTMLAEHPAARRCVRASIERLPLRDRSVDLVVCCRLLHHLAEEAARRALVAELARVSARHLLLSFWDAASWPALRRRLGLRAPGGRAPIAKGHLRELLAGEGFELVGFEHSFRFLSMQAFAIAARPSPRGSG